MLLCTVPAIPTALPAGEDAVPLSAAEVRDRWHSRLDDRHFIATVRMEMSLAGLIESRHMMVIRDDIDGKQERVLIRFDEPADLRGLGLLYLEHQGRPNDYFIYQPSIRRIRRMPSTVVDDDVYGVDLEFLGFGVAQSEPTEIRSMRRERVGERAAYRLEERALEQNPRFEERTTWIDAESFVPLKTEHRRRDKVVLLARTERLDTVQGVVTPLEMYFEKASEKRQVRLFVDEVDYERAIPEADFSLLNLMKSLFTQP
jgi:hypothetical protein